MHKPTTDTGFYKNMPLDKSPYIVEKFSLKCANKVSLLKV